MHVTGALEFLPGTFGARDRIRSATLVQCRRLQVEPRAIDSGDGLLVVLPLPLQVLLGKARFLEPRLEPFHSIARVAELPSSPVILLAQRGLMVDAGAEPRRLFVQGAQALELTFRARHGASH